MRWIGSALLAFGLSLAVWAAVAPTAVPRTVSDTDRVIAQLERAFELESPADQARAADTIDRYNRAGMRDEAAEAANLRLLILGGAIALVGAVLLIAPPPPKAP